MSLEYQNPSKTSEKMGYFDRVTVSSHILLTANQETEGLQDRLTVYIVLFFTRHFVSRSPFGRRPTVRAHFGQSNFLFFRQKRKKEILLILIIFTYFKVRTKIEKKKMVSKIDHFSNFEVRFKITKNTING